MKTLFALLAVFCLTGCTENTRAKTFGGTMNQEIPCDTRLVEATWKSGDLWYLVRKLDEGETPRKYSFKESSTWGAVEGEVRFEEKRCN